MNTQPNFCETVTRAKQYMAEGREKLRTQHEAGSPGIQVCARLTDVLDTVVLDIYEAAIDDLGPQGHELRSNIVLIPYGGYGRRDVAPDSDVDLMLLSSPRIDRQVAPLARRLVADLSDVGLDLGFSVRTISEACSLAHGDATIYTSLVESRYLAGSVKLFSKFASRFRRESKWRVGSLISTIDEARRVERREYGETVYLLEPNVKRSRGGLRDIQLLRWIGFARYGESEPDSLYRSGVLPKSDQKRLRRATEFLLRLRNDLHFHAGRAHDLLTTNEQLRLAEKYNYPSDEAMLAVERFMQDYFRHSSNVRNIVSNFVSAARPRSTLFRIAAPLIGHQVEGDFRVGPVHIRATRRGLKKVCGDVAQTLRLMDLSNLYDRRIDVATWDAIRQSMAEKEEIELTEDAIARFLSLLSQPARLANLLRRLHELRVLEKIVPGLAHARNLLQFNEYHKYTVDEHCFRAVQKATEFVSDPGPLGDAYRTLKRKRTLHLALLMHDLGKGHVEDHSEVGRRLASEAAELFKLPSREGEKLELLIHQHLKMSHLAFRRDTSDESIVVDFAVEIGTPDTLKMLYLITCADLASVGPGVLNDWKVEVLTELYHRAMRHLSGDGPSEDAVQRVRGRREKVRKMVAEKDDEWYVRQVDALPPSYLRWIKSDQIVEELDSLRELSPGTASAWARFLPDHKAMEFTVGAYEQLTPGVFHRLTGALTSHGLQILSADIFTLADGLVLDRFYVEDPDYTDEPPPERIDAIRESLIGVLTAPSDELPSFRKTWRGAGGTAVALATLPTRVKIDNSSSEKYTILDVFAHDRRGLLYTITRSLYESEVSISVAKIGTHVDQVVDVFYVTDNFGAKIDDESRLAEIRRRLLEAIDQMEID